MTIHFQNDRVTLHHGDCIEVMKSLLDESVDSIVTDPPYGLGFMGKAWDDLPPSLPWALECLRVLKPGGYLLAFGGTRTWHRLAVAVEDAGFEIRDSIAWLYGSGFPKSMDVSKAIDKAAGAEREVVSVGAPVKRMIPGADQNKTASWIKDNGREYVPSETVAATDEAKQWEGWGTALKPAFEPIVVARKPLAAKTVAANVLEHGTGALNIDASRVATTESTVRPNGPIGYHGGGSGGIGGSTSGRFPANVILDQHAAEALDEQSGIVKSGAPGIKRGGNTGAAYGAESRPPGTQMSGFGDSGGASRFFHTFKYQAKASKAERPNVAGVMHPTVKPVALMQWLVRLVTPPDGTVLEPFAGSGSTVTACKREGFRIVAIEREESYLPLIMFRITAGK